MTARHVLNSFFGSATPSFSQHVFKYPAACMKSFVNSANGSASRIAFSMASSPSATHCTRGAVPDPLDTACSCMRLVSSPIPLSVTAYEKEPFIGIGTPLPVTATYSQALVTRSCRDFACSVFLPLIPAVSALVQGGLVPSDITTSVRGTLRAPEGAHRVPRTLVVMSDGTNPPCTKADTAGVKGRNTEQAKSRQLRVTSACEYVNVTGKGVPIPIKGSFSYAVTDKGICELTSLIREHAVSRGSGTAPRVQCVADGEEALEKAMRDALPFALFTNDFMHAAGYMNACCERLGIADAKKEFKTCRAIMLRHGAGSAVDRIRRLYAKELESSKEAMDALGYLDKRRENMRYGWLRKNGYYISSCHIEAAARIIVARRCKQAGMHWRLHNAACVCAIIAKLRSAA